MITVSDITSYCIGTVKTWRKGKRI